MTQDNRDQAQLKSFLTREDGAITVDWIALTAAMVFMGIGAAFYIATSVPKVADQVSNYMTEIEFDD